MTFQDSQRVEIQTVRRRRRLWVQQVFHMRLGPIWTKQTICFGADHTSSNAYKERGAGMDVGFTLSMRGVEVS